MPYIYHVAIKKSYAQAILDDLEQIGAAKLQKGNKDIAVGIIKEIAESMLHYLERLQAIKLWGDENNEVPEWQKEEVRQSIAEAEKDPSILIDGKKVFEMLKVK